MHLWRQRGLKLVFSSDRASTIPIDEWPDSMDSCEAGVDVTNGASSADDDSNQSIVLAYICRPYTNPSKPMCNIMLIQYAFITVYNPFEGL